MKPNVDIAKHIYSLLFEYTSVIIPGLGAFTTRYSSAKMDEETGQILPPAKTIDFNDRLKINDGHLISHIAQSESIDKSLAEDLVHEYAENLRTALDGGERISLAKIGDLFKEGNDIKLEPAEGANFSLEAFGLAPVELPDAKLTGSEEVESPIDETEDDDDAMAAKIGTAITGAGVLLGSKLGGGDDDEHELEQEPVIEEEIIEDLPEIEAEPISEDTKIIPTPITEKVEEKAEKVKEIFPLPGKEEMPSINEKLAEGKETLNVQKEKLESVASDSKKTVSSVLAGNVKGKEPIINYPPPEKKRKGGIPWMWILPILILGLLGLLVWQIINSGDATKRTVGGKDSQNTENVDNRLAEGSGDATTGTSTTLGEDGSASGDGSATGGDGTSGSGDGTASGDGSGAGSSGSGDGASTTGSSSGGDVGSSGSSGDTGTESASAGTGDTKSDDHSRTGNMAASNPSSRSGGSATGNDDKSRSGATSSSGRTTPVNESRQQIGSLQVTTSSPANYQSNVPGGYYVITGAFGSKANADKMVSKLKRDGYNAYVLKPNSSKLYRTGIYATEKIGEAERIFNKARKTYTKSAWVLKL